MANVFIYGTIARAFDAWAEVDTTLQNVKDQLMIQSGDTDLNVYIKSIGGDVREGWAIYDELKAQNKPITTIAEGEVYSIASVVFLAGNVRKMRPNAQLMIHNPWTYAQGDAGALKRLSDELQAEEDKMAKFYADKTGQPLSLIKELMSQETYISADEALKLGFATEITQPIYAKAHYQSIQNPMSIKAELVDALREIFAPKAQEAPANPVEPSTEPVTPAAEAANTPELDTLKADIAELKQAIAGITVPNVAEEIKPLTEQVFAMKETFSQIQALVQKMAEETETPATNPAPVNRTATTKAEASTTSRNSNPKDVHSKLAKYRA